MLMKAIYISLCLPLQPQDLAGDRLLSRPSQAATAAAVLEPRQPWSGFMICWRCRGTLNYMLEWRNNILIFSSFQGFLSHSVVFKGL